LTNHSGVILERYAYTAHGELTIMAANGTLRTTSLYNNRYTYTGREHDPDLNLYHFRARLYDPIAGRFITRDPLGFVDGMSVYRAYFGLGNIDPSGMDIISTETLEQIAREESIRRLRPTLGDEDPPGLAGRHTGKRHYSDPPSKHFLKGRCRIAVKCFYPAGFFWRHCGLVIIVGNDIFTVDGTGGEQNNFDWTTGKLNARFRYNINNGTIGPFVAYDISVCECLRRNSVKWNSLDIPRSNFGFNSNTSLGCLLKRCNLKVNFSWNPQSYEIKCCQWRVSSHKVNGCNELICDLIDCCKKIKGW
jgi:RHS repeat-associated protein